MLRSWCLGGSLLSYLMPIRFFSRHLHSPIDVARAENASQSAPLTPSLRQIKPRQLLQVGIAHGLQFIPEPRVQLPHAGLLAVASRGSRTCRVFAGDLPGH